MTMIKYGDGDNTDCCLADQFIEALGVELPPHLFQGYSGYGYCGFNSVDRSLYLQNDKIYGCCSDSP